jgi:protein gp37
MAFNSGIEWTETTWNPVTGCTRASAGCDNCYAVTLTRRLAAMGQDKYGGLINPKKKHFNGTIRLHYDALEQPLSLKKPRVIFVNSMSDLFHKEIPLTFIQEVFRVMRKAYWHQFQILTKRAERLVELSPLLNWPENVWQGVSVEDEKSVFRIDHLRRTGAYLKFLSLEPLIGPLANLDLLGIDWVIVGGESGLRARPMRIDWVIDIRDQCQQQTVPFFFKQWGGRNKKAAGRELGGKTYDEMPRTFETPQPAFL